MTGEVGRSLADCHTKDAIFIGGLTFQPSRFICSRVIRPQLSVRLRPMKFSPLSHGKSCNLLEWKVGRHRLRVKMYLQHIYLMLSSKVSSFKLNKLTVA